MDYKPFLGIGAKIAYKATDKKPVPMLTCFTMTFRGPAPALEYDFRFSQADHNSIVWYTGGELGAGKAEQILDALGEMSDSYQIVSYLGTKREFGALVELTGRVDFARRVAIEHCDLALQILCQKGWYPPLNALLRGAGLADTIINETSPLGDIMDYNTIMNGLSDRGVKLISLAEIFHEKLKLKWTSQRGRPHSVFSLPGCLTVMESLNLDLPDTSWMNTVPESRESHVKWAQRRVPLNE